MSRKADAEKKEKEQAAAAIDDIEKAARERFEADQQAAQEAAGKWDWVEDSQYYYNAKHRWVRCSAAGWVPSRGGAQGPGRHRDQAGVPGASCSTASPQLQLHDTRLQSSTSRKQQLPPLGVIDSNHTQGHCLLV